MPGEDFEVELGVAGDRLEGLLCDGEALFVGEEAFGLLREGFVFVVGFEEGDDSGGGCGFEPAFGGWEDEALRGPACVDDDEVDAFGGLVWAGRVEAVGAFHDGDTGVVAECPGEHAVACVDGEDVGGVVSEEAVGEAAGGATEVGAHEVGGVEVEGVKGGVEFEPAAGGVGG